MTGTEPKVYAPEGSIFQLGKDVLNGWEGRWLYGEALGGWYSAKWCRTEWPHRILEVRRIPEKTVMVAIPESLARWVASTSWITGKGGELRKVFEKEIEKLDDRT